MADSPIFFPILSPTSHLGVFPSYLLPTTSYLYLALFESSSYLDQAVKGIAHRLHLLSFQLIGFLVRTPLTSRLFLVRDPLHTEH